MAFTTSNVLPLAPDMFGVTAEGTYFMVANAQSGLATAAAPTSFSDTNPFIAMFNKNTSGGASIYLDYIKLVATAAGTAGTQVLAATQLDFVTDRYTSGGTDLTANIVNPNGNATGTSAAKFRAGNITASAKTSVARQLDGQMTLLPAIPVALDTMVIKFGSVDTPLIMEKVTNTFVLVHHPKVVIPPQGSFLLHLWLPSQSGASSYLPVAGWVER